MNIRRRHADLQQIAFIGVLLGQLITGTILVTLRAQSLVPPISVEQAVQNQRQTDLMASLDTRVTALEKLDISPRLAVLDDMRVRIGKIELLAYGQIFALAGTMVLTILQIWKKQEQRHHE